jgi:hypothetical protein
MKLKIWWGRFKLYVTMVRTMTKSRQENEIPPTRQVDYLMLHVQKHHDNKSLGKEK